jgi:hypothetical protein
MDLTDRILPTVVAEEVQAPAPELTVQPPTIVRVAQRRVAAVMEVQEPKWDFQAQFKARPPVEEEVVVTVPWHLVAPELLEGLS